MRLLKHVEMASQDIPRNQNRAFAGALCGYGQRWSPPRDYWSSCHVWSLLLVVWQRTSAEMLAGCNYTCMRGQYDLLPVKNRGCQTQPQTLSTNSSNIVIVVSTLCGCAGVCRMDQASHTYDFTHRNQTCYSRIDGFDSDFSSYRSKRSKYAIKCLVCMCGGTLHDCSWVTVPLSCLCWSKAAQHGAESPTMETR